jgi:hypothetical protein
MRNHAKSAWAAIEAPEILLAISWMREEAFVLAFEVYESKSIISNFI